MSKIGLALGGGGSKGSFQAGALHHLDVVGILDSVDVVAGISVGSLNAVKVAEGDIEGLLEIWRRIKNRDVFRPRYSWLFSWMLLIGGASLNKNWPLRKLLEREVNWDKVRSSRQKKLLVGAATLQDNQLFYGNNIQHAYPELLEYVLASTAIPAAFPPSQLGNHQLVDGGVVNINPLNVLIDEGCDTIILIPTFPMDMKQLKTPDVEYRTIRQIAERSIELMEYAVVTRDIKRLNEINNVVDSGAETHYRKIKLFVIDPEMKLGNGLEFDPDDANLRINMGFYRAQSLLNSTCKELMDL